MFSPIAVAEIDLARPLKPLELPATYRTARVLVRVHGAPIGEVDVSLIDGTCAVSTLSRAIVRDLGYPTLSRALERKLATERGAAPFAPESLFDSASDGSSARPNVPVTVAVCTRDRAADLAMCLDALVALEHPDVELLVIDNAPPDESTHDLVRRRYPMARYVREPRPGLDWARNRAILEATHDIIAFTDDDVLVDPGWVTAIANVFAENPGVMAVTGLVLPYELETEPQALFERYGGFARGFVSRWFRATPGTTERASRLYAGAGHFGTGANMAFRKALFDAIGGFDPALDVGTVTSGGGDLDMFFRVLREGHTLVYEPRALVRHRHRREYPALRAQIANNGIGFYSYLVRNARHYPDARADLLRFGLWWLWRGNVRRTLKAILKRGPTPLDLHLAELTGTFIGLTRYARARRAAAAVAREHTADPPIREPRASAPLDRRGVDARMAVRVVDISDPLASIEDVCEFDAVRVFVLRQGRPLGHVDIRNFRQAIGPSRLIEAIANRLPLELVRSDEEDRATDVVFAEIMAAIERRLVDSRRVLSPIAMPRAMTVSVVVATLDRPDDLRRCLTSLRALRSIHPIEIIVVDNNPRSGVTPPVVAGLPGVVLVEEPRRGLAYARNAGIVQTRGDIIASTDDDVTVPADWIDRLVAPFAQPEVMVVTGNVLPAALEDDAQRRFEEYGGLSRGYEKLTVDGRWFRGFRRSVPTWRLGCTANAAFRASIFADRAIGLMDEALGPGMPSGVGEDTYVFYKVLKAGYSLVYEPRAYVWHRHRASMQALRRQLYDYSKGHVAYQLTTLLRDRDLRALASIGYELPRWHLRRLHGRLRGWNDYPLSLVLLEVRGNLAGPWALWRSRRRVRRLGHSGAFVRKAWDRPLERVDTPA